MDESTINELKSVENIEEFINLILPFYPGFNIKSYTIENIEKELYHTLIKLIAKIISYSPKAMRSFLKDYLLQFEITNIKSIILGAIVGDTQKERTANVNFLVEEILDNVDFIKGLLDITNLDEIVLYMEDYRYYKAVREGIRYYKENNETFILVSFLERIYYQNMADSKQKFDAKEKKLIKTYVDSIIEIYNLHLIYRALRTGLEKKILSQLIIENSLFFTKKDLTLLMNVEGLDEYFLLLRSIFSENQKISDVYKKEGIVEDHLMWSLDGIYLTYIIKNFETNIENIEYSTIFSIIELIIKKEKEILFDIMPNMIKIIHKKFEDLRD